LHNSAPRTRQRSCGFCPMKWHLIDPRDPDYVDYEEYEEYEEDEEDEE